MALLDRTPPELVRYVPTTLPGAYQAIAALEDRILSLQAHAGCGSDVSPEIAAAHAFLAAVREAFDVWPMTEAELDAAHEAAHRELEEWAERDLPDVPLADTTSPQLLQYQAEGR